MPSEHPTAAQIHREDEELDFDFDLFAEPRDAWLDRETTRRFREAVAEWAASDDGDFPTWAEQRQAATAELELLREALGDLADLAPEVVMPERRSRHIR